MTAGTATSSRTARTWPRLGPDLRGRHVGPVVPGSWRLTSFRILVDGSERKRLPLSISQLGVGPMVAPREWTRDRRLIPHAPRRGPARHERPDVDEAALAAAARRTASWRRHGNVARRGGRHTSSPCPTDSATTPFAICVEPRCAFVRHSARRTPSATRWTPSVSEPLLQATDKLCASSRIATCIRSPNSSHAAPRAARRLRSPTGSRPSATSAGSRASRERLEQERRRPHRVVDQGQQALRACPSHVWQATFLLERAARSSASASVRSLGNRPASSPMTATSSNSRPFVPWAVARISGAASERSSASRCARGAHASGEDGRFVVGIACRPAEQRGGNFSWVRRLLPIRSRRRGRGDSAMSQLRQAQQQSPATWACRLAHGRCRWRLEGVEQILQDGLLDQESRRWRGRAGPGPARSPAAASARGSSGRGPRACRRPSGHGAEQPPARPSSPPPHPARGRGRRSPPGPAGSPSRTAPVVLDSRTARRRPVPGSGSSSRGRCGAVPAARRRAPGPAAHRPAASRRSTGRRRRRGRSGCRARREAAPAGAASGRRPGPRRRAARGTPRASVPGSAVDRRRSRRARDHEVVEVEAAASRERPLVGGERRATGPASAAAPSTSLQRRRRRSSFSAENRSSSRRRRRGRRRRAQPPQDASSRSTSGSTDTPGRPQDLAARAHGTSGPARCPCAIPSGSSADRQPTRQLLRRALVERRPRRSGPAGVPVSTSQAIRATSVVVLPDPAGATHSTGPGGAVAARAGRAPVGPGAPRRPDAGSCPQDRKEVCTPAHLRLHAGLPDRVDRPAAPTIGLE